MRRGFDRSHQPDAGGCGVTPSPSWSDANALFAGWEGTVPFADAVHDATDPSGARVGFWQPGTHPGFGAEDVPGAPTWFELHTDDFPAAVTFYERHTQSTFLWGQVVGASVIHYLCGDLGRRFCLLGMLR